MKILFASRWFPFPPSNGSKLRVYNLLRGLAECHDVTLVSFAEPMPEQSHVEALRAMCRDVRVVEFKPYDRRSLRARLGFFSLLPRSVVDTRSTEMEQCIDEVLASSHQDMVVASELGTAAYAAHFHGLPALFEGVEIGVLYEQFARATSFSRRLRHGLTWAKHRRYVAQLLRAFQACTVVSEQERQLLARTAPGYECVSVIPNGIDLAGCEGVRATPRAQSGSIIFAGALTFDANYDAMRWFAGEVYPLIRMQAPGAALTITGNHANLPLPMADQIKLTGFVDDVRPLVAAAGVSIAPIRIGAGTRLKILEAMALRTPVVATSKGAEGLDVRHGEHLLIADTAADFADAVLRLLSDPELRQKLVENAYELVRRKYDWRVILPRFLELVERVGHAK